MAALLVRLVQLTAACAPAAPAPARFSSLTLVGEMWERGTWSALDAQGHEIGPPLKRGDPNATLIASPRESPDLLSLSKTAVLCSANDTVMSSSDGGRSWRRHGGNPSLGSGYVPAPHWLKENESSVLLMDVEPVAAYIEGCYPDPSNCTEVRTVVADASRQYTDWGLSPEGVPAAVTAVGRKGPNVWRGLPKESALLCTSCGGGQQLPDGTYVYLVVVQFGPIWQTQPVVDKSKRAACCNNSVASFTSPDGLEWTYTATVGLYDETRIYQEGPNECDVVLLKDKKTLWAAMRTDGGDGVPSHRTLPFLSSTSTDGGKSVSDAFSFCLDEAHTTGTTPCVLPRLSHCAEFAAVVQSDAIAPRHAVLPAPGDRPRQRRAAADCRPPGCRPLDQYRWFR